MFALAAIISTLVMADSRRRRFPFYAVAAWTLLTLFFPLIFLLLYVIARFRSPRTQAFAEVATTKENSFRRRPKAFAISLKYALPCLYAVFILSLVAIYFYRDYTSADAHFMRAGQARLHGQKGKVIEELRAALRLEPTNAHTHKLLAAALAADQQWSEALMEYRAAERGGEPDDELPFRIATTLDALKRTNEAAQEYKNFLHSQRCAQKVSDPLCEMAKLRARAS
jgi:cytochrome c-type biogenesis protein CcmH/NrfG